MVSLFGRGFDSLQLHNPLISKPLIHNGLAAFFMPSVPMFRGFWGRFRGRIVVLCEP